MESKSIKFVFKIRENNLSKSKGFSANNITVCSVGSFMVPTEFTNNSNIILFSNASVINLLQIPGILVITALKSPTTKDLLFDKVNSLIINFF